MSTPPNCHQGFQYSVRRTRRSWSCSESETRGLTTVDEEEIFLFDDDDLRSKKQPFQKTALFKDLEPMSFSSGIPAKSLKSLCNNKRTGKTTLSINGLSYPLKFLSKF